MTPELWYAFATVLILAGLAGTILPVIPGAPLMLVGMLIVAWADGFQRIGWITLAVLAGLAALSVLTDLAAGALGARGAGASRIAFLGAALGALVGVFFALPGIVLGPFVGAVIGEFSARGSLARAGRVGVATWLGMLLGGAAKVALVLSMIVVFALARFA